MATNALRFLELDGSTVDCNCDILDKEYGIRQYVSYMFDRTSQMFEYKGLPDTIPAYILEFFLQCKGVACIAEVKGNLYAFSGSPGGAPDPYYRPTFFVVANPALELSKTFRIVNHFAPANKDTWSGREPCVMCRNDTQMTGLLPLYSRYSTQLVENEVSIRCAQINARQQSLISASTDRELASAKEYIDNLEKGKIATVAENPFIEGIKAQNVSTQSSNSIIQLIELQQYLKASWFNEIGLNSNFNMKREYLSTEEIAASTDMLLPLADDMLMQRELFCEEVNKQFGTSISVSKNSAWENKEKEIENSRLEDEQNNETGGNNNE